MAVPGRIAVDGHLPHPRVRSQRLLDLARFNPVPADLQLCVDAAQKFDLAIGAPSGQVAGAVSGVTPAVRPGRG